jgi:hypothetical protein
LIDSPVHFSINISIAAKSAGVNFTVLRPEITRGAAGIIRPGLHIEPARRETMKYTVVKQFSNGVIDNFFSFIFKWADCAKMFVEFLWSFLEIWIAFFLIFYNALMYVYYILLFFIDRGTESSTGLFSLRGTHGKVSTIPKFELTKGPSTVPGMYGSRAVSAAAGTITAKTAMAASQTLASVRSAGTVASRGLKQSAIKSFFGAVLDFFKSLGRLIAAPFKKLVLMFDRGVALRNQREAESDKSKSLIDEYIKEYEQKKR